MTVSLFEGARPPIVKFFEESFEDRTNPEPVGHPVFKAVHMVEIRQPGNKDTVTKDAEAWLRDLHKNVNMKPEWVDAYKKEFERYKSGQELTPTGMHVKLWPQISKAQAEMLIGVQILTVEDLAAANEHSLGRIGIGARELQQKARAWLESADSFGTSAEELTTLRNMVIDQDDKIKKLLARTQELESAILRNATPANDPLG